MSLLDTYLTLVIYPITVAHEWTHAAAFALVGSADVSLSDTKCDPEIADDAPEWLVRVAYIAPSIVGSFIGFVLGLWIVLSSVAVGGSPIEWLAWVAGGVSWAAYTLPSADDLLGALDP